MMDDPLFFLAAAIAVLIAGISKGGFGGGLGVLAVPVMALVIAPSKAAAIMLPILCVMDLALVWVYRKSWDRRNIVLLLPGAITGIVIGGFSFHYLNDDVIRLIIGLIAIIFTLNWVRGSGGQQTPSRKGGAISGWFWGGIAGFTSFVAHAGGPPVNIHLMPQRLDKTVYQATTVIFFIVVNYTKLIPYAWLGLLDGSNLLTSLYLLPLVPVGIWLGMWLHHRVNDQIFYRLCYVFLLITGLKLSWDGISNLFGG